MICRPMGSPIPLGRFSESTMITMFARLNGTDGLAFSPGNPSFRFVSSFDNSPYLTAGASHSNSVYSSLPKSSKSVAVFSLFLSTLRFPTCRLHYCPSPGPSDVPGMALNLEPGLYLMIKESVKRLSDLNESNAKYLMVSGDEYGEVVEIEDTDIEDVFDDDDKDDASDFDKLATKEKFDKLIEKLSNSSGKEQQIISAGEENGEPKPRSGSKNQETSHIETVAGALQNSPTLDRVEHSGFPFKEGDEYKDIFPKFKLFGLHYLPVGTPDLPHTTMAKFRLKKAAKSKLIFAK